jgi:CheY-like chemotaxis protein
MLRENEYDLFLIDIRTPVMNGEQLYHVIETEYPELVKGVVFTTGDVMDEYTLSCLSSSGRLFLPKPFYPDELRITIGRALRHLVQ